MFEDSTLMEKIYCLYKRPMSPRLRLLGDRTVVWQWNKYSFRILKTGLICARIILRYWREHQLCLLGLMFICCNNENTIEKKLFTLKKGSLVLVRCHHLLPTQQCVCGCRCLREPSWKHSKNLVKDIPNLQKWLILPHVKIVMFVQNSELTIINK